MISSHEKAKLHSYMQSLAGMDLKFNLLHGIKRQYNDTDFKPVVHSEIMVLEHFHSQHFQYVDDDRYIGCSKLACYCCHLYMTHHSSRCVIPQSHQDIWVKWSPPSLQGISEKDVRYKEQRDILIAMSAKIRDDALAQISWKAKSLPRHPDSQTGITAVGDSMNRTVIGMSISDGDQHSSLTHSPALVEPEEKPYMNQPSSPDTLVAYGESDEFRQPI
jgi:hypothetical protein